VPNKIAVFLLIVALFGFVDSTYLTVEHFQGRVPPCSIVAGCEKVLTGPYSTVYGMPVALGGSIYYFLVLVGISGFLESRAHKHLKWALLLTILGFMASLWFIFLQVFIIHSYCAYCMGSALTSTILFVTAMNVFAKYQGRKISNF